MNLLDIRKAKLGWRKRFRVGRGESSGYGKTCGKGNEGQNTRSGISYQPYFEGGQMPLPRKVPKRGFNNRFKTVYQVVNLKTLENVFQDGNQVTTATLIETGVIHKGPVKILGNGNIAKKLTVVADAWSKSAEAKITKAGGTCQKSERKQVSTLQRVSLTAIQRKFNENETVDPQKLLEQKLITDPNIPVKITNGLLTKKLVIIAQKFSRQAIKKIRAKKGQAKVIE